jgi:hypothetical protein
VERGGDVAGLERGQRGAEAAQGEGEVVGAGPPVGGRGRVRRDGRAQERVGGPGAGGRRSREEDEQREEEERARHRREREEAATAVVVAPRHLAGARVASERRRRRDADGDRVAALDCALFFLEVS